MVVATALAITSSGDTGVSRTSCHRRLRSNRGSSNFGRYVLWDSVQPVFVAICSLAS